ncbi:MAG: peptide-binding protein [Caldiserica bacterium]|nr:MAG: peptide-binding protein [Caldisericota bacterium]
MSKLLILLLLFSCSKKKEILKFESKKETYGDYIIEASIGEPSILNPILATDSTSGDINSLIYNGLVKYNENLELVGDLAERWEIKDGGKKIVFHLRKGVKWHDGVEFTSKDVIFTYKKLTDPDVLTPYSSDFKIIKKVEAPTPYTFIVYYEKPFAPSLESWGIGIVAAHIYREGNFNTHPRNRNPVGTGPYKLEKWKASEYLILKANDDYFEGRPYIDKVVYRIIPDSSIQFLELRKENIDLMGLTPFQWKFLKKKDFLSNFRKYRYPSFSYTYLGFNLRNELFKEKKIRRAIAMAIDKKELIDAVLFGLGKPATGPFPPQSWAYNSDVKDIEYNPEKAKRILEELGWKDTDGDGILEKDGKKFHFVVLTNQGNKQREIAALIIQENLRKIGIKMDIRIVEWSSFIHNFIETRKFEAVILGWALSRDPDQFSIWHSSEDKEGGYNFIGYKNKEVDKLLEIGRTTFDFEKRKKIYRKIHKILNEEQPYCFLYVPDNLVVLHKRFKNVKLTKAGISYNFIKWYVPESLQKYRF